MLEVEVFVPLAADLSTMGSVVEATCAAEDLRLALKDTLAKYPGSVHWHFKRGAERGTLEITWWEKERRLWFKVAAGRTGDWIEDVMPRLKRRLGNEFAREPR